jgi:hypothetical protein
MRKNLWEVVNFEPLTYQELERLRMALNDSDKFLEYNKPGYARA